MTAKEMANHLDGSLYPDAVSGAEHETAKESGLIIVFGYSDDNAELQGLIDDEIGCYGGAELIIYKHENEWRAVRSDMMDEVEDAREQVAALDSTNKIKAIWSPKDEKGEVYASWVYETDIPHETFRVFEEESDEQELYCIGIVFSVSDLK